MPRQARLLDKSNSLAALSGAAPIRPVKSARLETKSWNACAFPGTKLVKLPLGRLMDQNDFRFARHPLLNECNRLVTSTTAAQFPQLSHRRSVPSLCDVEPMMYNA